MSTERSCLNFRGPINIMTVALTVNIPIYKVARRAVKYWYSNFDKLSE